MIVGPTAVGKTAISLRVASALETEIISCDSRQFYREMSIGTAKPSDAELRLVKHHFINSHSITQDYDAAQFGDEASAVIREIFKTRSFAVMCGGSGLYVKAVLEGFDDIPEISPAIREDLSRQFNIHGIEWLQHKMMELDPEYFEQIDKNNPHRLIRALEVRLGTGHSISAFHGKKGRMLEFGVKKIGLDLPREILYERIDHRMDEMISAGLFEEAASLYPYRHHQALQTVGYQEIFDFMDGAYDKAEAIRLLKRNTRRYAKRQLTWFKRDRDIHWFDPADESGIFAFINAK